MRKKHESAGAPEPAPSESAGNGDKAKLSAPEEITPGQISELQKKAEERDEFLDQLKRARADYINYQKRVRKDIEVQGEYAIQKFMEALTPVFDNLQRTIASAERGHSFDALLEGVKLTESELYKTLAEHNIKRIETVGKPFDPAYHEAVTQEITDKYPDATVTEEVRLGFTLNGRTIVPARVKVSKMPEAVEQAEARSGDTQGGAAEETPERENEEEE